MRFDVLDMDHLDSFAMLDTNDFMVNDMFPLTDAYGMYDEKKPIGLMLMSQNKDRMVITWMNVAPTYQDQGVADFFLAAAFVEARDKGVSKLVAYLSEENVSKDKLPEIELYLREHLFKEEKPVPAEKGGGKLLIADVEDFDSELTLAEMMEEIQ